MAAVKIILVCCGFFRSMLVVGWLWWLFWWWAELLVVAVVFGLWVWWLCLIWLWVCGAWASLSLSLSFSHIFALFPPISPVSNSLSIFFSFSFAWPNLAFDGTSFSYLFLSHFSLYGLIARFRFRQHFVMDPVRLS